MLARVLYELPDQTKVIRDVDIISLYDDTENVYLTMSITHKGRCIEKNFKCSNAFMSDDLLYLEDLELLEPTDYQKKQKASLR